MHMDYKLFYIHFTFICEGVSFITNIQQLIEVKYFGVTIIPGDGDVSGRIICQELGQLSFLSNINVKC